MAATNICLSFGVVHQFHDVVEKAVFVVPPDVQHFQLRGVSAGDAFLFFNAGKFPFERALRFKGITVDELDRP